MMYVLSSISCLIMLLICLVILLLFVMIFYMVRICRVVMVLNVSSVFDRWVVFSRVRFALM